jgi:nicotinamidase-related amidase
MAGSESLSKLLSKKTRNPTTYKALVVLGLQDHLINEASNAPPDTASSVVTRILKLVPKFRNRAGYIIWVRLDGSDKGEELPKTAEEVTKFFANVGSAQNIPNKPTEPSAFTNEAKELIDPVDIIMDIPYRIKSPSNSFLATLQAERITELFFCGYLAETSCYAMMYDAARQGCNLHVIEDCLSFRENTGHEKILKYVKEEMCAEEISSSYIDADLNEPLEQQMTPSELQTTLEGMTVQVSASSSKAESAESPQPASVKKGKKIKYNGNVQTRKQQRIKDNKEVKEERQRVRNALLGIPYKAIPTNDPIVAESSKPRDATSAQPKPGTRDLNDSTSAPHAVIKKLTDISTAKSKSSTKDKEVQLTPTTNEREGSK